MVKKRWQILLVVVLMIAQVPVFIRNWAALQPVLPALLVVTALIVAGVVALDLRVARHRGAEEAEAAR